VSFRASDDSGPPPKGDPFVWPRYWATSAVTALVVGAATKLGEWAIEELKAKRKPKEPKP
jgi:hypothetical protein